MTNGISYEEYLENNDRLIYTNVGVSMLPLLRQGKDLFIVEKKGKKRCRVGDVVLYKRPPDKYVLHRIIEVTPTGYTILGDNCVAKEYDIKDKAIIGIMTGYVRNGKEHSVNERGYKTYTLLWLTFNPLRVFLKRVILKLKRIAKKILKGG
ncbi:MAG: S26 family signal peptidase [Ruminococcus sp.]|nr:S26 family signal peptidase [Ruminococcus sp.]